MGAFLDIVSMSKPKRLKMITYTFLVEDTINGKTINKEVGFSKSNEITVENFKKLLDVAEDCDLSVFHEASESLELIEKEPDLAMIKNGCQLRISRKSERVCEEETIVSTRSRSRRDAFYKPPSSISNFSNDESLVVPSSCQSGRSFPGEKIENEKFLGISSRFRVGFAETIGKRPTMEDALTLYGEFRERKNQDLFCVFDGHGGSEASKFVAKHLPHLLADSLEKNEENPFECLKSSFLSVNEKLKKEEISGGTTALVALFLEETIYIANCGDTRAVLYNGEKTIRCSIDHKPGLEKEEKRIKELGGKITFDVDKFGNIVSRVNGQLSVSRALGDFNIHPFVTAEPDIHEPISLKELKDNSFLILACDGLWDLVTDEEAVNIVSGINDPEKAACKLRDIAYTTGSTDNITAIVIRFPPFPE